MNNKELAGLLREAACRADIEINGVDGAYVVSRISTVINTLEKAAEGVEPVGHFYNRPHEGRIGVEWCCDHLDDGAALFSTPPAPAVSVPDEVTFHDCPHNYIGGGDTIWAVGWNACREAILAAATQPEDSR